MPSSCIEIKSIIMGDSTAIYEPLDEEQFQDLFWQAGRVEIPVGNDMGALARSKQLERALIADLITEADDLIRSRCHRGTDENIILEAGRRLVTACCLGNHHHAAVPGFEVAIMKIVGTTPCHSADFKPNEVVRIIDDPHLIRLGIAHVDDGVDEIALTCVGAHA